ncbi:hypothetical protein J31TS4_13940 [Paenibacillus sp. J31TS4]|uniref:hypothetical protein n=1 Tax=Paenibacillus sp. J31TS4 TaxID=2807195 RepID=UPI001B23C843|nr:hypothetical protein [Paenibacillus sp. J31TS4]GIP38114.1 hypothetical protein J31TS4_13940 [Paenibacillus sp. J31TS4]
MDSKQSYQIPGTLGEADQARIKELVLLPILLTLLERDRRAVESSSLKMKEAYLAWLERAADAVHRDLAAIRRSLKEKKISLYLEAKDESGIRYLYVYRGYQDRMFLRWEYVKAEVEERLAAYTRPAGHPPE